MVSWPESDGTAFFCQLLEQFVRMGASYLAWLFCLSTSLPSCRCRCIRYCRRRTLFVSLSDGLPVRLAQQVPSETPPDFCFFKEKTLWYDTFRELAVLNLPLTLNRILLNVLHSIESALLPGCLVTSGLSRKAALSQYGILTGMALPMIFFHLPSPTRCPSCFCPA